MDRMRVFRAICILLVHLILLGLATPGLDLLPRQYLGSEQAQQRMKDKYGATQTAIAVAAADLNRKRFWIEDTAEENPTCFPDCPVMASVSRWPHCHPKIGDSGGRGAGLSRTRSQTGLARSHPAQPTIRPVTETTVAKAKAGNRFGLGRLIVERAKADFPRVRRVDIVSLSGKRPGDNLKARHRMVATAPNWSLEEQ